MLQLDSVDLAARMFAGTALKGKVNTEIVTFNQSSIYR